MESIVIEKEKLKADIPQTRSPWFVRRNANGEFAIMQLPLDTRPGTKANAHLVSPRETLGTEIEFEPTPMFAFDGATNIAASGESFADGDFLSRTTKEEMNRFLCIGPIAKNETYDDVADRIVPGCRDPAHPDHWFVNHVAWVNRHDANLALQDITVEPERKPEPAQKAAVGNLSKSKTARCFGAAASDGKTKPRLQPYLDDTIRARNYQHDTFKPTVNGATPGAKAARNGLVRIPILPTHFDRNLTKAVWAWAKEANIAPRLALCVIHCAMRTMESNLKRMLTVMMERYTADKKGDRAKIDAYFNTRLKADLSLRKIISCDKKGVLNDITLNGGECRALMADIARAVEGGRSHLFEAVRETYASLHDAPGADALNLCEWEEVLKLWAISMGAAYKLRPTEADRRTFRESSKLYVVKKAMLNSTYLVWYDWQMYSVMAKLFDRYESLMLISQEGMEAVQKQNNSLQRHTNNGCNGGRIPTRIIMEGIEAIKRYLLDRKSKMISPCKRLWQQQLLQFMSSFHSIFERCEAYKAEGNTMAWTDLCDEHDSFEAISRIRITMTALYRVYKGRTQCLAGGYVGRLRAQLKGYYAPCACELTDAFWMMRPADAAKLLSRQRRERWAER